MSSKLSRDWHVKITLIRKFCVSLLSTPEETSLFYNELFYVTITVLVFKYPLKFCVTQFKRNAIMIRKGIAMY